MVKNLLIGLFIILALGILFLVHYFVYFSLVKFFRLEIIKLKLSLALLLFFLPVSFILTSILAHYYDNAFSRFLYFTSGLWLGLVTTIVTFFAVAWLVYGFSRLIAWPIGLGWLGGLALILAVLYSAYGVFNAQNIRVKNITVSIKNLPPEWQGQKVVQISDVHLGHVFRQDFFDKLAREINDLQPAAVFITGDLFDGMGDDFDYVVPALNSIEAPKGIYFVTGNHETYFGVDKVYDILNKTKVKIFQDDMVDVEGLQIIGLNYPKDFTKKQVGEIIKKIPGYNASGPSILLYHSPSKVDEVRRSGIKLQLSGHTHRGQIFPFRYITNLVYHGYDYGLNQLGDYSIYTSSGVGAWGPTMRTDATPEIVVITLTSIPAISQLSQKESIKEKTKEAPPELTLNFPLSQALKRITKKPFGIKVSPNDSPIKLERFSGYHTGTDFEIFEDEKDKEVAVLAICDGKIIKKGFVSGYGGVMVEQCQIENQPVTVIYGHISLENSKVGLGNSVKQKEIISFLGRGESPETDGERKHLHLGIHKGQEIDLRGYVKQKEELGQWLDFQTLTSLFMK
ncbi:MAG: metallophosphoesterase [bacterium]